MYKLYVFERQGTVQTVGDMPGLTLTLLRLAYFI